VKWNETIWTPPFGSKFYEWIMGITHHEREKSFIKRPQRVRTMFSPPRMEAERTLFLFWHNWDNVSLGAS